MKPLRIALIHADRPRDYPEGRMVGIWSYDVPEFSVAHIGTTKTFTLSLSSFEDFDIVVREDHKCYGEFVHDYDIPVVYYVVDSTLSDSHYKQRLQHAQRADLVLVEQDDLARFSVDGQTRRLPYCVNERLYHDYGPKLVDVGFYVNATPERDKLARQIGEWCSAHRISFEYGKREGVEYAKALSAARINVSLARTPTNRPHRTFDVMACKSCLLTSPLPAISGESRTPGVEYVTFNSADEAIESIDGLLSTGDYSEIAEDGYDLVQARHTWAIRARELRQIFNEVFGL